MKTEIFEMLHLFALGNPVAFFAGLAALGMGIAWFARDFI